MIDFFPFICSYFIYNILLLFILHLLLKIKIYYIKLYTQDRYFRIDNICLILVLTEKLKNKILKRMHLLLLMQDIDLCLNPFKVTKIEPCFIILLYLILSK